MEIQDKKFKELSAYELIQLVTLFRDENKYPNAIYIKNKYGLIIYDESGEAETIGEPTKEDVLNFFENNFFDRHKLKQFFKDKYK